MSFKNQVVKDADGVFVLPKIKTMNVEAKAFLNDDLFAQTNESLWLQAFESASYPGVTGVYLMPDTHTGYGIPVGGVVVTDGTIIQSGSGYDVSCFTGDTKVSLVDGRNLSFQELVSLYGRGGDFYVYSMTPEGRVTSGRAHSPRKTRQNAPLVEVTLDNGESLRCTPDHEWMLRDGTYKQAKSLNAGDSLMPLYRSFNRGGYCDVIHPSDGSVERMYKVAFREAHGYIPEWPKVIHHDLFLDGNINPSKTNDDPRFLREMDQSDHFHLHAQTARERAQKGEIGWGRLHRLRPEQMSQMGSENMTRLNQDPDFCVRRDRRASEMNRACREAGKYDENWSQAGERGREHLIRYNQSSEGREQSRVNGLLNRGRIHSEDSRENMRSGHAKAAKSLLPCPLCGKVCRGRGGLSRHVYYKHNNHKVISVRHLETTEDVFCLTVEKYANFALNAGVFVHNCGVVYLKVPGLNAADISDFQKRKLWIEEVEKRVAVGVNAPTAELAKPTRKSIMDVLHYGAKALGVSEHLCERLYIPVEDQYFDTNLVKRSKSLTKALGKAVPQLGSVGGGNHFVEMQVDKDTGEVWVMVHCGSRGYGWQVANHFFYAGAEARGLPSNQRERSWLYADEDLGKQYWAWHNSAANYAVANRHTIVGGVQRATQKVYGTTPEVFYEISHNLVQEETLVLPDGSTKKGFVHRKGATRAFPAGHPDLNGTVWEKTGHPCLIPGSMYDGAAILYPLEGAYKSGCSVNHGSGRTTARGEAKTTLAGLQHEINREMREVKRVLGGVEVEGIASNCHHIPLDECCHVYKDLDTVIDVLVGRGIARLDARLYPVANIKGAD